MDERLAAAADGDAERLRAGIPPAQEGDCIPGSDGVCVGTEQRQAMEAKICSPKDGLLRVNRSIQAEGNFAYVKQDLDFRRFLLRGNVKVAAEWLLFSLALNILRLHHKIQNMRLGSGLEIPSSFPVGL